jgi:hypothetical protein
MNNGFNFSNGCAITEIIHSYNKNAVALRHEYLRLADTCGDPPKPDFSRILIYKLLIDFKTKAGLSSFTKKAETYRLAHIFFGQCLLPYSHE